MSDDEEVTQPITPNQESAEDLINYSQGIRKSLVQSIVGNGVPDDEKKQRLLLTALSDMDHTSLQRVKLDIDRQGLENDRQAQEIVQKLHEMHRGGMRFDEPVRDGPPETDLPEIEPIGGETVVGVVSESSKAFLERMENEDSNSSQSE